MFTAHPVACGTVPLLPLCRGGFIALLQLQAEMNSHGHRYKFNHTISKTKLEQTEGKWGAKTRRELKLSICVSFFCASIIFFFLFINTMQCLLLHANTLLPLTLRKSYTCLSSLSWGRKVSQEAVGNQSDTHLIFRDVRDEKVLHHTQIVRISFFKNYSQIDIDQMLLFLQQLVYILKITHYLALLF